MISNARYSIFCLFLCTFLAPTFLPGKVIHIEITERDTVLDGKSWGEVGAYELWRGRIFFGTDPFSAANQQIVDIHLSPVNGQGLVESMSDIVILKPIDQTKSKVALIEVSNRGGKFVPSYFLQGQGRLENPDDAVAFGDGLLMEMGFTIIWLGWQFDVPEGKNNLNFFPPIAKYPEGSPIIGRVRSDWTLDTAAFNLKLGHRNHRGYPAYTTQPALHQLTMRDGRDGNRITIDTNRWGFGKWENNQVIPDPHWIHAKKGFEPHKIYELVYYAENPPVVGLGLSAIRDMAEYVKSDDSCVFKVTTTIAAGVSQTGRFLRHFLYQGFNKSESGIKAFDGLMIMTAGAGRGSFNHRFAQPSRDGHQYSAFLYPTDIFPFTSKIQFDSEINKSDGLLAHLDERYFPKIFYINTGYEYYGRAAALIHSSIDGSSDIAPMSNERIYHLASGQHFVDGLPVRNEAAQQYVGNPLQFKPNYRALLVNLHDWVSKDMAPPDSKYPLISKKELVKLEELNYPRIPGFVPTKVAQTAYRTNYGPQWSQGIITNQPPELGTTYPTWVPQVDPYGNELGGIRNFELEVPLATYLPYSLYHNTQRLNDFRGLFIPFPTGANEVDERPEIEELYSDKKIYLDRVKRTLQQLTLDRFILRRDIHHLLDRANEYWNWMSETQDKTFEQGLSAMTFNIRYDNPGDGISSWEFRRDQVADIIGNYRPDFLGLQEALHHQCKDVARSTKGYRWIGVGRDDGDKAGEFTPIYYQHKLWKIITSDHFWLSKTPEKVSKGWDAAFERIVSWASFKHKGNGKTIFVFNTHFDHRGVEARSRSIELLKSKIDEIAGDHPFLVMGDFNFGASSEPYISIAANDTVKIYDARHLSSTPPLGSLGTFSGFTVGKNLPIRRIDHLFASKHFTARDYEVVNSSKDGFYASDHFAVFSKFDW